MRCEPRQLLNILLSAVLMLAPLLPNLVHAAPDAHAGHAAHAQHESGGEHVAPVAPDATPSSCAQHENCNGQCCAACAQCFSAALALTSDPVSSRSIQMPTVTAFHDTLLVFAQIRPPQAS